MGAGALVGMGGESEAAAAEALHSPTGSCKVVGGKVHEGWA